MYESFYGFSEKPFSILPDPSFLYLGKHHSLAFSMLEYGLLSQAGFTVITGEVGSGKTTLIRHLLTQIGDDITVGLLSNTPREIGELLQWVLLCFEQDYQKQSKVALFDAFSRFLIDQYANKRRTVLIVDEAQNLSAEVLEELRMLSNINADKHQVLQLILVGQPELREKLRRRELRQFSQRVSVDYHLKALNRDEVHAYIMHRTRHAGRAEPVFSEAAMDLVFEGSGGIPRVINVICDTALVYGFADQQPMITEEQVNSVLEDKRETGLIPLSGQQAAPQEAAGEGASAPLEEADAGEKVKQLSQFDKELARQLFSKLLE